MRTSLIVQGIAVILLGTAAQADDLKIALIYSKTGPLEAYGKQTQTGLMMGLDYATSGTMTVNGKKIVVIEKDDQGKPDLASRCWPRPTDDKADLAIGPTSSGVALAMLPVAEEYKKILLVEPAVADSITGDKWNKYIFRTGRNSSQDAISNAVAIDKPGVTIATLAQDNAFGRDGVKAFKDALKKAKLVHEEYLPTATTDFTAGAQRLIDKLKDQPGRKIIWIVWAGAGNPFKIVDLDLKRYGIEIADRRQHPAGHGGVQGVARHGRRDLLLLRHSEESGERGAGRRALQALQDAAGLLHRRRLLGGDGGGRRPQEDGGDTNTDKLISTMEGMSFDTPKGKMTFRKEDHQAMQSMYHFKIKVDPAFAWGVPELVHEIKLEEMDIPIRNKR